mgnify:CR=1 FL=1
MLQKLITKIKKTFLIIKNINQITIVTPKFIFFSENKTYLDYPSNYQLLETLKNRFGGFIKLIYPQKPMTFVAMEVNKKEEE